MSAEEYRLALEALEAESDRFWSRVNVALIIQGALLALLGGIIKENASIAAAVCFLGAIFSLIGFGLIATGRHYVDRWVSVIMRIETVLSKGPEPFFAIHHMNDAEGPTRRLRVVRLPRTTTQIQVAFCVLFLFWAAFGIALCFSDIRTFILKDPEHVWSVRITLDGDNYAVRKY